MWKVEDLAVVYGNQERTVITQRNTAAVAAGLLALLPMLTGCEYAGAVAQNIAFGIRDCVNEARLSGCLTGGDPLELMIGALINGARFGVQ